MPPRFRHCAQKSQRANVAARTCWLAAASASMRAVNASSCSRTDSTSRESRERSASCSATIPRNTGAVSAGAPANRVQRGSACRAPVPAPIDRRRPVWRREQPWQLFTHRSQRANCVSQNDQSRCASDMDRIAGRAVQQRKRMRPLPVLSDLLLPLPPLRGLPGFHPSACACFSRAPRAPPPRPAPARRAGRGCGPAAAPRSAAKSTTTSRRRCSSWMGTLLSASLLVSSLPR